ncbi:MAG: sigma 54-interacting transcriptional regulator, partial [Gammaproteobacteria bacterium]|nr:sigma 54-interacting transcriptional regulator [Gammaproteobacteria bacterium]
MPNDNNIPSAIELQSLIDSHTKPFVVVGRDYRILAVNQAYEQIYNATSNSAVGQPCYKVSHGNSAPCSESGEDCPHEHLFKKGEQHSCLHVHYDPDHRMHQVRVTAYPLVSSDGELYMGEMIEEIAVPNDVHSGGQRMVGKSQSFTACIQQLNLVAAGDIPVLLQGETGTGKELAASYIHANSSRSDQPFITVDCTALTESLFEAEVFGHARGAFTGSVGERTGLFAQADGGTLLLDEIGELPLTQQAKLLRVLETGQYRRVGGRGTRKADVRLICATNQHLWELVKEGRFREDLYYRIACLTVRMPSLRERTADIPMLADSLLAPISQSMNRNLHMTPKALKRLEAYDYPGNIRELRNILFVAATHCNNGHVNTAMIDQAMGQLNRTREQQPQAVTAGVAPGAVGQDRGVSAG